MEMKHLHNTYAMLFSKLYDFLKSDQIFIAQHKYFEQITITMLQVSIIVAIQSYNG